jgi:dual specificity protein kinase YAK1
MTEKVCIDVNNYILSSRLGKGAFSEVFLYKQIVRNKAEPKLVVYKNIKDKYYDYCKREIELLELLSKHNNEFVIKYYGSFQRLEKKILIFEYMEINLYSFYKKRKYNMNNIIKIMYQMFRGLKFIHQLGIIHSDVKPENVMIDVNDFKVKLIDFGSYQFIISPKNYFYVCTRYYRAPELIYNLDFDEKIDIWSAGCIFVELIKKKPLFQVKNQDLLFKNINDLIGSPSDKNYIKSIKYRERFNPNALVYLKLPFYSSAASFNHRFGRSINYYNTQVVTKYYIIQLLKKILVYSERASAEECLESPIFLEYKLKFKRESIPILQEKML